MTERIHKCPACSAYTMEETCSCGQKTVLPRPAKFSLLDKYAEYRRAEKQEELRTSGLY